MRNTKTDILRYVNRVRETLGDAPLTELPKGRRVSAFDCVLARAIGRDCSTCAEFTAFTLDEEITTLRAAGFECTDSLEHPVFVQRFVRDFDNGLYPELDEEEAVAA